MRGHAFSRGGDVCRARGGELQSREVNKQRDGHISISACMARRRRRWANMKGAKRKKVAKNGKKGVTPLHSGLDPLIHIKGHLRIPMLSLTGTCTVLESS